jgi:hypothetical protein
MKAVTLPNLLVEDGFGLTTITGLFTIVTPLSLRGQRILSLLVLSNLVWGMLLACLALAICDILSFGLLLDRRTYMSDEFCRVRW